jgi:hypothetical protein
MKLPMCVIMPIVIDMCVIGAIIWGTPPTYTPKRGRHNSHERIAREKMPPVCPRTTPKSDEVTYVRDNAYSD